MYVIQFEPGESVMIEAPSIKARVDSITVSKQGVSYTVNYWDEGERCEEVVDGDELTSLTHDAGHEGTAIVKKGAVSGQK